MSTNQIGDTRNLNGLGGWLILVAIGIVVTPMRLLLQGLTTFLPLFRDGSWDAITNPAREAYHPLWQPYLLTEMGVNTGLFLAMIYLAFLFFRKKKQFPKWYIAVLLFGFVFVLADAWAIRLIVPDEPIFDPDTLKTVIQGTISIAIWVPYMLISKRVKATFTQ